MDKKLSTCNIQNTHKYSIEEVKGKLNEIEGICCEIMGTKSSWSDEFKYAVDLLRMSVLCGHNTVSSSDIEHQYESRYSKDDD